MQKTHSSQRNKISLLSRLISWGRNSVVECGSPKPDTGVRFPPPLPKEIAEKAIFLCYNTGMKSNYISKTISYFWALRVQIIKYIVIGVITVVFDMATLIFFKETLKFNSVLAVSANQIFIIVGNFALNKYWAFKSFSLPHRQFIRYLILAVFNYSLSIFVMWAFNQVFDYDYRIVRLVTIFISAIWTFFFYKYWVYHVRS